MVLLIPLLASALAGEVSAEVDGSVVRGVAHLSVPPERFLAALADPRWESQVAGRTMEVQVKAADGRCAHVAYVARHPIMDAAYELKRCARADGWESTLISSDAFSTYRAVWTATANDTGTTITYEADFTTSLWVPNSIVRSETKRSVRQMLQAMVSWADARVTVP